VDSSEFLVDRDPVTEKNTSRDREGVMHREEKDRPYRGLLNNKQLMGRGKKQPFLRQGSRCWVKTGLTASRWGNKKTPALP